MSNLSYDRSARRERELVNYYRGLGWYACRSAGSHSQFDVWAYNPFTGECNLIQVKTKRCGRNQIVKDETVKTGCTVKTWEQRYE